MKEFYSLVTEKKLKIALQALEDIQNPLAALQRSLKPGEVLNGLMAFYWTKDSDSLKDIAAKALKEISSITGARL